MNREQRFVIMDYPFPSRPAHAVVDSSDVESRIAQLLEHANDRFDKAIQALSKPYQYLDSTR